VARGAAGAAGVGGEVTGGEVPGGAAGAAAVGGEVRG